MIKLQSADLQGYFQEVITSETAQSLKPNRVIFEYALKQSKARPDESIMIGDNQEADIQGATNAGLDTVFVNHIQAVPQVQSTYMIHHLQELEGIF
jgi:putative hydrolase of the HAD superfamily